MNYHKFMLCLKIILWCLLILQQIGFDEQYLSIENILLLTWPKPGWCQDMSKCSKMIKSQYCAEKSSCFASWYLDRLVLMCTTFPLTSFFVHPLALFCGKVKEVKSKKHCAESKMYGSNRIFFLLLKYWTVQILWLCYYGFIDKQKLDPYLVLVFQNTQ